MFYRSGYNPYLLLCSRRESGFDRLVDPGAGLIMTARWDGSLSSSDQADISFYHRGNVVISESSGLGEILGNIK